MPGIMRKPKVEFIRNSVPLPATLPVSFVHNFSADRTKLTAEEWSALEKQAYIDAAEAYLLREAVKNPEGYEATTYFDKK